MALGWQLGSGQLENHLQVWVARTSQRVVAFWRGGPDESLIKVDLVDSPLQLLDFSSRLPLAQSTPASKPGRAAVLCRPLTGSGTIPQAR